MSPRRTSPVFQPCGSSRLNSTTTNTVNEAWPRTKCTADGVYAGQEHGDRQERPQEPVARGDADQPGGGQEADERAEQALGHRVAGRQRVAAQHAERAEGDPEGVGHVAGQGDGDGDAEGQPVADPLAQPEPVRRELGAGELAGAGHEPPERAAADGIDQRDVVAHVLAVHRGDVGGQRQHGGGDRQRRERPLQPRRRPPGPAPRRRRRRAPRLPARRCRCWRRATPVPTATGAFDRRASADVAEVGRVRPQQRRRHRCRRCRASRTGGPGRGSTPCGRSPARWPGRGCSGRPAAGPWSASGRGPAAARRGRGRRAARRQIPRGPAPAPRAGRRSPRTPSASAALIARRSWAGQSRTLASAATTPPAIQPSRRSGSGLSVVGRATARTNASVNAGPLATA